MKKKAIARLIDQPPPSIFNFKSSQHQAWRAPRSYYNQEIARSDIGKECGFREALVSSSKNAELETETVAEEEESEAVVLSVVTDILKCDWHKQTTSKVQGTT